MSLVAADLSTANADQLEARAAIKGTWGKCRISVVSLLFHCR